MPDEPIERRACEIRLRAERKAGLLLRAIEKAKAGRPKKNQSRNTTNSLDVKTLKQLGISRDQSSRWQQLADVPEDQFDAAQERGEVAGHGGARNFKVENPDLETPGLGKIGVTKQNLYDWRKLREAGGEPLADEIDAAQERGEMARAEDGRPTSVRDADTSPATFDDLDLDRRRVSEWRKLREAVAASAPPTVELDRE
jgi:hypothetical protein